MMSKTFTYLLVCLFAVQVSAQDMTNQKLEVLITKEADSVLSTSKSSYQFILNDRLLVCMTDSTANRMRIISPVAKITELKPEHITGALAANFHSALDVRYAVSDGVMWSAFIHPLKELSDWEVKSAIHQTYNAASNFGTTYQSTGLFFSPASSEKEEKSTNLKKL